jgi:hypothetical protein
MKIMVRATQVAVALAVLCAAACTPPDPEASLTGKVKAVVERSKTTRQTYAAYSWNKVAVEGDPVEEWGAEFQSDGMHRVETPRDRVVANCEAMTGFALSLVTGKTVKGPSVARAACGINTNKTFTGAEWQGIVRTPFGEADRVRLVDRRDVRTYDVTPAGVIVRTTYAANKPGEPVFLNSEAVALLSALPAEDIFTEASLARSYVPDRFKTAPKPAS